MIKSNLSKTKHTANFIASLINETTTDDLEDKVCDYLNVESNADIVYRLKWLGFFEEKQININNGTNLDVLLDLNA